MATARQHLPHGLRLFTVAVGAAPDHHALSTLARCGGGFAERLDRARRSTWAGVMERQLRRCQQPALVALAVQWQLYEDERGRVSVDDDAVFALGMLGRARWPRLGDSR